MPGRLTIAGRNWLRLLGCLLLCGGCGHGLELSGKVNALEKLAKLAELDGARNCAPRELAIAKSQLRFARLELDQGFALRAEKHLAIAEPNAQAARWLSPLNSCSESADHDADGISNAQDACPNKLETFNGLQDEDGCPDEADFDQDGIVDSLDACTLEPEDKDHYLDSDGCPDLDNDFDAVLDSADKCPSEPEDPDGFQDEDGCSDPDNDQDTVPDLKDLCPLEPGSTTEDPLGCPTQNLAIVTDCEVKITEQIHFELGRDKIRPESYPILDAIVSILNQSPNLSLEIQGHTDNRGTAANNKKLSQRRSDSVRNYLISRGISAPRLTAQGYGSEAPISRNDTATSRALNRRVQFIRTDSHKRLCQNPQAVNIVGRSLWRSALVSDTLAKSPFARRHIRSLSHKGR